MLLPWSWDISGKQLEMPSWQPEIIIGNNLISNATREIGGAMSKILKVVDGKHYVEYGPPCERCGGTGDSWEWLEDSRSYLLKSGGCPACHGTGLLAVELWPDARKAATLQEWGYYGFEYFRAADQGVNVARTENKIGEPIHGEGKDLTEALTNLVIAVAEEE